MGKGNGRKREVKLHIATWRGAHLCMTPPALREAEYLQSALGILGCKRKGDELSWEYR